MHRTSKPPSPRTVTRRAVLEWLGVGAVLGLGGDLLAALTRVTQAGAASLPFAPAPNNGPPFDAWDVRVVDRQDLAHLLATWRLEVGGLVARPATYTFADLLGRPRIEQVTDLHCVEGWSVFDIPWVGIRLGDLIDTAGPAPDATHVTFRTVRDKYNDSLPLEVARESKTLLAYGVGDDTLPLPHGFPLRVVVPRLLGYKNAKYVYRIELATKPLESFWVSHGYDYHGEVPAGRLRPGTF